MWYAECSKRKEPPMKLILIDIDNTLLDFDAYIRQTM